MSIEKQEVQRIAKLARLELTSAEMEKMGKELSSILDYFKLLQKLDVSDIKPAFETGESKNVMREDKAEKYKDVDEIIEQTPQTKNGYVKVKEVLK